MSQHTINLFMWGYQPYFRVHFELVMDSVMKELGVEGAGGKCMLVGTRVPGAKVAHDVCVEPEDGPWPLSLFADLPAAIEAQIKQHPDQNVFYGDEPSMRDKPENIRRDSVRRAVRAALASYDADAKVCSFVGSPMPVDGYYVATVVQLPVAIFERFRPLREPVTDGHFTGTPSLIHAAVNQVLHEAHDELQRPDPGRFLSGRSASAREITKRAAASFLYTPRIAIRDRGYAGGDLFERLNLISSLMYEGTEGKGRLLLASPESGAVDMALLLETPVPFAKTRWARKVLQMAASDTALVANTECILGLGNIMKGADPWAAQNVFEVEFHDHYHWSLSCGDEVLLVSRYGAPSLPHEKFPRARLLDTFQRLFPNATPNDIVNFTSLFDAAVEQRHGSMLVVAADAATEAERLSAQGTKIVPTKLTPELYRRVSNIDGTVIVDPSCICHAVGVILDGPANEACTPSRGARFNSGVRYVAASETPRLAIVVSDDKTVDVIPVLRPQVRRSVIEQHIAKLEAATVDNFHSAINWLEDHRFYLDRSQCDRVNAAQKKLDGEPREVGEIRIIRSEFAPNPLCTSEYFEPEGAA